MRRGRLAWGALVLIGVAGLGLLRRYRANQWVTPYDLADRSADEVAQLGAPLGARVVDAAGLRALLRAPTEGHRWLIFWAGNTSTYFAEAVASVRGLELPVEIGVLIVAPPGFDSPGMPTPERVEGDALGVVDWLRAQHGAQEIVTMGFSMGTFSALAAAQKKVRAVVLMGATTRFDTGPRNWLVHFRRPVQYGLPAVAPKVSALVLQGELDEPGQGPAVATWLGAKLVTLPGLTHEETPKDPHALQLAGQFIRSALQD